MFKVILKIILEGEREGISFTNLRGGKEKLKGDCTSFLVWQIHRKGSPRGF
jgi:hypothetical protein